MIDINKSDQSLIDVEMVGVTKKYNKTTAVDNISFKIGRGQFFSILGPSGCGKTTTMRMLAGFIDPDDGEVWIGGKLVNGIPANQRDTNLVFQQLALFPHMNVFDNIGFGLRMKRVPHAEIKSRVNNMLKLVRLEDFGRRRIQELSGGQQQRVAIARALVNQPQVLLLDEPLGALDLQLRLNMQIELKRVQKEVGTTFVYVTHDQGEALTMSDQIAIMNNGKIIQIGDPDSIYEQPVSTFVAKFIGNTNLVRADMKGKEPNGNIIAQAGSIIIKGRTTKDITTNDIWVSIRPEKIMLGSAAEAMPNHYNGYLESVSFKGTHCEYHISIEKGLSVDVFIPNQDGMERLAEKSRVEVGWAIENARILTD
jgi:spermidine/putrescine transport system ATP-binding protein